MKRSQCLFLGPALGLFALFLGCSKSGSESASIDPATLKAYAPLPDVAPGKEPITEEKIVLGRMLYYETRLSANQKISCNSCHELTKYGVDNEPTSVGHNGKRGDRNSQTVYNAALHFVQFWDGRAADVEEQAKGPVLNPVEMGMTSDRQVVAVLKSMPDYVSAFQRAFPNDKDPVTYDNTAKAIGAFERKLITPARWDRFLKGEQTALTPEEKAGFHTFVASGCQTCHAGALLGGNMYQKIGLVKAWPDTVDTGRYQVTKIDGDKFLFKVPSLRNIDKTGPYFHDGKIPTLDGAVAKMSDYQVGKTLSAAEIQSIVTWMRSLTGEIPAEYIKAPELPKSTSKTPKPNAGD